MSASPANLLHGPGTGAHVFTETYPALRAPDNKTVAPASNQEENGGT